MPAVKSIVIRNQEGQTVGQRFEASESFKASIAKSRVPMVRPDGRVVSVSRKLAARDYYGDKGFTEPKQQPKAKE